MTPRRALERLNDYQTEILLIIADKAPLVAGNTPHDVAALARARWALMRALTAYSLFKHHEIFDPLIAKCAPPDAPRVVRMKRACLALGDEFRAYVQKWSASDVEARWAEYGPVARTMIARLRDHMARERVEIAAILEKA